MTPAITTILSRWIEPPREISQDATLADLGMTCGGILESIKCDLEEQVLAEVGPGLPIADSEVPY